VSTAFKITQENVQDVGLSLLVFGDGEWFGSIVKDLPC
jgi:hypothetical protein